MWKEKINATHNRSSSLSNVGKIQRSLEKAEATFEGNRVTVARRKRVNNTR